MLFRGLLVAHWDGLAAVKVSFAADGTIPSANGLTHGCGDGNQHGPMPQVYGSSPRATPASEAAPAVPAVGPAPSPDLESSVPPSPAAPSCLCRSSAACTSNRRCRAVPPPRQSRRSSPVCSLPGCPLRSPPPAEIWLRRPLPCFTSAPALPQVPDHSVSSPITSINPTTELSPLSPPPPAARSAPHRSSAPGRSPARLERSGSCRSGPPRTARAPVPAAADRP
jgi:hypothetical protein